MTLDLTQIRHFTSWLPTPRAPATPQRFNRVGVRRFWLPGRGRRPCVILVLSPGFMGGVNCLNQVGRTLAAAGDGAIEVWAIARRNQLLEDPRGMQAAVAAHDAAVALEYYFSPGDGRFEPIAPVDVGWMGDWGLQVALNDLRAVVREAHRAVDARGRVLLGGHSLGGMLAQCYAAWDFEGTPGFAQLHGLVMLDGAVGGPEWTATVGLEQYHAGTAAIEAGEVFWNQARRGAAPQVAILAQILALSASLPASRREPALAAGPIDAVIPLPKEIAFTNEALLGFLLDPATSPAPTFRARVGTPDPTPIGVIDGRPLVGWRRTPNDPTDLQDVAAALLPLDGTSAMEWYASRRLNAEVDLASNLDGRDPVTRALADAAGLRIRHNASVRLPIFAAVTSNSEQNRGRYTWYRDAIASRDFTLLELPEYEHLDPLFARDESGANRCITVLLEWLLG